ncbi:hypothetical protein FA15DRAFT_675842 [Coprinopsis marcescibilis]|uniref:Uncharacterized protein n=1 Tax=Coprinopsis marcescibilis TaxID=230819 RepID=A0A5C3KDE9_COPMA|nr:hypothetical protein FA15DRAFT_675842 [Coprinopsis marcescibilis]
MTEVVDDIPVPTSTQLTFTYDFTADDSLEGNKFFKQALCVNPPADTCDFGPCPNTDVTGIGSQISTYITALVFAIVLVYMPWMGRPMLYAHLSVIYSLMIAAAICIAKSELTQTDCIFVIVSVISPASIYLWYLSIVSIWNPEQFPVEKENKRKSKEIHALRVVCLASLAFAIGLVVITFVDSDKITFSQPGCKKAFGEILWFLIPWMIPLSSQALATAALFFLAMLFCWLWARRSGYSVPEHSVLTRPEKYEENVYTRTPRVDLITWTERILTDQYPEFMTSTLATCIATVLQFVVIPTLVVFPVAGAVTPENIVAWIILVFGCFRDKPREGTNRLKFYGLRVLFLVVLAAILSVAAVFPHKPLPSVPDVVLLFMVVTVSAWCWRTFALNNMKVFLPIILIIFIVIAGVATWLLFWYIGTPQQVFWLQMEDVANKAGTTAEAALEVPSRPLDLLLNTFMVTMVTYSIWFIMWCGTSFWAYRTYLSFSEFMHESFSRAHILKFCTFIVAPNVFWVEATTKTSADESPEYVLNFGQLFSLIVSLLTVITLLDEALQVKRPVWLAIFLSRKMPEPNILDQMAEKPIRYGFGAEAGVGPATRPFQKAPEIEETEKMLHRNDSISKLGGDAR